MRIAVVGLGGVGAYIGAKLCALKDEHEIIFVARGKQLREIQEHGLRLIDVNEEQICHPSAALEKTDEHLDIIFLCTKSYHSVQAIEGLSDAITEKSLVIPVSNGVNNAQMLRALTPAKVIDACVYIVSHILSPGVVKKETEFFSIILDESSRSTLEPLLQKAGLRHKFSLQIKRELWKKFLFISAMGAMTSFYNMGMGSIYKEHKEELRALLEEISSVGEEEGVSLGKEEIEKALETASRLPLDAPTSLWLDLKNGKENELESLCFYLIETAEKHGISAPLMQKIYDRLR